MSTYFLQFLKKKVLKINFFQKFSLNQYLLGVLLLRLISGADLNFHNVS